MFVSMSDQQQRANINHELKATPDLFFWLAPAMLVATVATIATVVSHMGLPGSDLAASFLRDAVELLIFTMVYVTIPVIVCALSDPVETRLAMRTLTASLFSLLPRAALLFETLGGQTATLTVPAMPDGVRFTIRPQPPIPSFGFSPGVSPQLE